MKIGIMGGNFDPPHIGHLIGAELALEKFALDFVLFIPFNIPVHRESTQTPAEKRLKMVKLAIKGNKRFKASDIEIKRGGKSYTIDTVRELQKVYKDAEFYIIIGTDQAEKFEEWKEYEELLKICNFIILTRGKYDEEKIKNIFGEKANMLKLELGVSSSEIRKRVKEGKTIKYMVPESVEKFIRREKLYL